MVSIINMPNLKDFVANHNRQLDALKAADTEAKNAGTLVGRYIEHPYADGAAVYRIKSVGKETARIEHVAIGDAWVLPAWGNKATVPLTTVQAFVSSRDKLVARVQEGEDWWSAQTVGAVVHYNYGFGCYVRGEIVTHEGQNNMMPVALVGAWDKRTISKYHVEQIENKTPFQPNAENMVENPSFTLRGEHPGNMDPIEIDHPVTPRSGM